MKKLLLFGNYGGINWGDEAICAGLISALKKTDFETTVVSANPRFTMQEHSVASVPRPPFGLRSFLKLTSFFRFLLALRATDLVIYGGGGLFQDREAKAPLLWSYYVWWARRFQKKYIIIANSVGPLVTESARKHARKAFLGARFISVRDQASQKMLVKLGIPNERIIIATDAVFLLRKLSAPKSKKGTLLMIRGDGKMSSKRIKKLCKEKALPKPIRCAVMDSLDTNFAHKSGVPIVMLGDIGTLRKEISNSRLVISSRLHGNLLALLENTPFLALSAAPKIRSFFEDRGLSDHIIAETASTKKIASSCIVIQKKSTRDFQQIRTVERKSASNILPLLLQ